MFELSVPDLYSDVILILAKSYSTKNQVVHQIISLNILTNHPMWEKLSRQSWIDKLKAQGYRYFCCCYHLENWQILSILYVRGKLDYVWLESAVIHDEHIFCGLQRTISDLVSYKSDSVSYKMAASSNTTFYDYTKRSALCPNSVTYFNF